MVQESPSIYIEGLIASNCKFYIGISERPKERFGIAQITLQGDGFVHSHKQDRNCQIGEVFDQISL
jgi:hypothetical protein